MAYLNAISQGKRAAAILRMACVFTIESVIACEAKIDAGPTKDAGANQQSGNEGGTGPSVTIPSVATECADPSEVAIKSIGAGLTSTCLITAAGALRCFGDNYSGQLGTGATDPLNALSDNILTDVQAVAVGQQHSCAVTTSGGVRCWGFQSCGNFGDDPILTDTRLTPPENDALVDAKSVVVGFENTCALTNDGDVVCWGLGYNCGSTVGGMVNVISGIRDVTAGNSFACALTAENTVRCWGVDHLVVPNSSNDYGNFPAPAGDLAIDIRAVAAGWTHVCVLTNAGGVRCWGSNDAGQLGDGTREDRASPPKNDVLTGVRSIAAGWRYTCAVMTTGTLRCWGGCTQYDSGCALIPASQAVDIATGVAAVAVGEVYWCALMLNGGVTCWNHPYLQGGDWGSPVHVAGTCQ